MFRGGVKGAHKVDSVRTWVRLDVSGQIPIRHPFRHNLEGVESYTYERNDVGVRQPFPYQGLSEQHLLEPLENGECLTIATMNTPLCHLLGITSRRYPQFLDANFTAIICSSKYVGKSTGGNTLLVNVE